MADSASAGGTTAMPLTSLGSSSTPKATSPEASSPDVSPNAKTAPAAQQHQPDGHILGLRKETGRPINAQHVFSDDYEKLLPEDEYGQEAAPNARVWRAYEQEAATYDTVMIGQARDGLDVMLVFAGLFSAVVTSFLVQVSQNLQPDFPEMTALLLHDLVVMQMQTAEGGAPSPNITVPSADPTAEFTPDALDVWVNGLWVVSLAISLTVALSAVLVKQWLHRYMALPSGTAGLRSHTRHFRFTGFEQWHVEAIIGTLPIIMHLSLALFFAGLILFYVPLRLSLACTLGVLSAIVLALYISSNVMPIFHPKCPYQTPLTDFIPHLARVFVLIARKGRQIISALVQPQSRLGRLISRIPFPTSATPAVEATAMQSPARHESPQVSPVIPMSSRQREARAVALSYDHISVDAMQWLFHMGGNPSVHSVVVHAISGLPYDVRDYARARWQTDLAMVRARTDLLGTIKQLQNWTDSSHEVERLWRSAVFLPFEEYWTVTASWAGVRYSTVFASQAKIPQSLMAVGWLANQFNCRYRNEPDLDEKEKLAQATEGLLDVLRSRRHDVPLHVTVWKELVSRTKALINADGLQPGDQARLLYFLIPPIESFDMDTTGRDPFPWTKSLCYHKDIVPPTRGFKSPHAFVDWLDTECRPLRPFRDVSSAPRDSMITVFRTRVMPSVFRFLIHHFPNPRPPQSHAYLEEVAHPYYLLLDWFFQYVLLHANSGDGESIEPNPLPDCVKLLFKEDCPVIKVALAGVDPRNVRWWCLLRLLKIYHMLARLDVSFPFPAFQDIAAAARRHLEYGPSAYTLSMFCSDPEIYYARGIMEMALRRGHPEAFRVFLGSTSGHSYSDDGWLAALCELETRQVAYSHELMTSQGGVPCPLDDFVTGLRRLTPAQAAEHLAALQEPRRLQLAALLLILNPTFSRRKDSVTTLFSFSSHDHDHDHDHPARRSVIDMLHGLRSWFQDRDRARSESVEGPVILPLANSGIFEQTIPQVLDQGIQRQNGWTLLSNAQKLLNFLEGGIPPRAAPLAGGGT